MREAASPDGFLSSTKTIAATRKLRRNDRSLPPRCLAFVGRIKLVIVSHLLFCSEKMLLICCLFDDAVMMIIRSEEERVSRWCSIYILVFVFGLK